jgi:hypothetical protein
LSLRPSSAVRRGSRHILGERDLLPTPALGRRITERRNEVPDTGDTPVILKWQLLPWLATVAAIVVAIVSLAVLHSAAKATFGFFSLMLGLVALSNFLRTYTVYKDQLTVSRVFLRRTVVLNQLVSAEVVAVKASQGRVLWHLVLKDKQGTKVRMDLAYAPPETRRRFLSALAPYIMAPGVYRSGNIREALMGTLW